MKHSLALPVAFPFTMKIFLVQLRHLAGQVYDCLPMREYAMTQKIPASLGLLFRRPTEDGVERIPVVLDLTLKAGQAWALDITDVLRQLIQALLERAANFEQLLPLLRRILW